MRFWELCRSGNWPTLVGTFVYFATSFGICALFGGAALDLTMSNLEIGLLLSAPFLVGALFLLFIEFSKPQGEALRTLGVLGFKEPPTFGVPHPGAWSTCFLYAVTFGGFAALTGYLTIFFHDRHGLSVELAAAVTTLVAGIGFVLRPVGGYLASRFGVTQLLLIVFIGAGVLLIDLAVSPPLAWTTILPILVMALLALGNGAVLQLMPQRFAGQVGVDSLLAGMAGGLGGCLLLMILGGVRHLTGGFSLALVLIAFIAFSGTVALINLLGKLPDTTTGQALEQT